MEQAYAGSALPPHGFQQRNQASPQATYRLVQSKLCTLSTSGLDPGLQPGHDWVRINDLVLALVKSHH